MLDDYESSYIDLNSSFLNNEYNFHDNEPCDLSFSNDSQTKDNTLSISLTGNQSFSTRQNSNMPNIVSVLGFYNPKYRPIIDDGKEYKYEDNPGLYRKIRK